MKKFIPILAFVLLWPGMSLAAEFNPDFVISDRDMFNAGSLTANGIDQFLDSKGELDEYKSLDLDGATKKAADIIYRVAQQFIISPKFIMVMLQKEQSLITDTTPVQGQYDWATGYAVCDDCNVNSSGVSKFKGFAKQIDSMAQQFRFGYMADLEDSGQTQTRMAPGRTTTIDSTSVTPLNDATAAMYTYTPHIEGNENFWRIWNDWFTVASYPSGAVLRDIADDSMWLIRFGKRKSIPSISVLASYFDPESVIEVDSSVILAYDEADALEYPNYSLVRVENGDVYLIVGGEKRRFQTLDEIAKFGYVPDEIIDGTLSALQGYETGDTITFKTAYPQGAVFQDTVTNTLYYVDSKTRHTIVSEDIRRARYGGWNIRPATTQELGEYLEGPPVTFPDGTLMMVPENPTVYVVSEGNRRPIINEKTFLELGYSWDRIVRTTPASVEVHQPGMLLNVD